MKKIFLIASLIMSIFVLSCTAASDKNPKGKQLTCYSYSHHGTVAQPFEDIEVRKADSCCTACVFTSGDDDFTYKTYAVGEDLLDSIQNVIINHKMYKYKDHYEPIFEVLDGDSWHYEAVYSDRTILSSGGHCAGPKDDGTTVINNIIKNYVKKCEVIKSETWEERIGR